MPTAGYRSYNYGNFKYDLYTNGFYWSSTLSHLSYTPNYPNVNENSKAYYLSFNSRNIIPNNGPNSTLGTSRGFSVRCLMNNEDAVTLYLNPNGGKVENAIIDADAQ
ncbi:hypothetical protein IKI14_07015 [bacterium]|nr:hypothetical protein [bacterium]